MKLDKRKVTVVKDIYIACDGKEFEDKDECFDYEMSLLERRLDFYTHDFEESDLDECTYVKTVTKADIDILIQLCDHYGISKNGIENEGIYMFESRRDGWVNITDAVSRIYGG